ncbi:hypothetical protein HPY42_01090 [Coprothermobacteraceae bacterium]|nr:hypothetical protein [Coprothermobacteraceae bacterium]
MAEYVLRELTLEELRTTPAGWNEAYDETDLMLIKGLIHNALEKKYGQNVRVEVYALGDLLKKAEELSPGQLEKLEQIPMDKVLEAFQRFLGEAVKFYADEENNLFVAFVLDLIPVDQALMRNFLSFWN